MAEGSQDEVGAAAGPGGAIAVLTLSPDPARADTVLGPIRRALAALPPDGLVSLHCDVDPTPLVAKLAAQGWLADGAVTASRKHGSLEVRQAGAPAPMDLLDLEAPEPLRRILEATSRLAPGEALAARTPCYPRPLLGLLERRGLLWCACERADGSGLVHVRRPA